jgi:hypothetical protein
MHNFGHSYSFVYKHNCGDESAVTHIRSDAETWDEVLDKFVSFLSQIYGYDISQFIEVVDPMTRCEMVLDKTPKDNNEDWR